ncbi:hypothetical protein AVEN_30645-1 [Araneus ventricosus]|uniref:Uncharacterized protein n=1 Tax=Araneus ventricosus TaxID=182803 RepID=A0A4Y2Q9R7_ARAVE|nr:hypothetical protein AVEN_30645-1 [Araneus ventricosus]
MDSRFPAMQVLWLGRGFYKVKHGVTSATLVARMTLATKLGDNIAAINNGDLNDKKLFSKMQPFSRSLGPDLGFQKILVRGLWKYIRPILDARVVVIRIALERERLLSSIRCASQVSC